MPLTFYVFQVETVVMMMIYIFIFIYISYLWVCLSAEGAEKVTWPGLSLLRERM